MLGLAVLSDHAFTLYLNPVYGSIPRSAAKFDKVLVPLVWLTTMFASQKTESVTRLVCILGCLVPVVQPFLSNFTGIMGPFWGPLFSYCVLPFPILLLSLSSNIWFVIEAVSNKVEFIGLIERRLIRAGLKSMIVLLLAYAFQLLIVIIHSTADFLLTSHASMVGVLLNCAMTHVLVALFCILLAQSKATRFLGWLSLAYGSLYGPTTHGSTRVNAILAHSGYNLVAREQSSTGYISVLDNQRDGFRVMRCDHSLLGGEWINKPEGHPALLNEPIYSIFVMLEAVRLVESPPSASIEPDEPQRQALVM